MLRRVAVLLSVVTLSGGACGWDDAPPTSAVPSTSIPRRTVVWLDSSGLDEVTASRLQRVGVDEVVVRRGTINLGGAAPVFRLVPSPPVAGAIPIGVALRVQGAHDGLGAAQADAVWRALSSEFGTTPAEIILDLPTVPSGMAEFVGRLADAASVPVVPLLGVDQLASEESRRVMAVARSCVVALYGSGGSGLRGLTQPSRLPLDKRLAPLAGLGIRVRVAIDLTPIAEPSLDTWGDDLDPLTNPETTEVRTRSTLDRTFILKQPLDWSGRQWQPDQAVALRWFDAARLNASFVESSRLVVPVLGGWDLVPLPPEGPRLGLGREALIRYLGGDGPAPAVEVSGERSGNSVRIKLLNPGPFSTAVTGFGTWVEVSASTGTIEAFERGAFDRMVVGTAVGGEWRSTNMGVADAVRLFENYLAPGEELESGPVRLVSRRAAFKIRWHLVLSTGEEVTGVVEE